MNLLWLLAACQAGIIVEGNTKYIKEPDFSKKINECLALLGKKAPSAQTILKNYVGKIRAFSKSGANIYLKPITIDIAKPTFESSVTWLASVLAHESIHAKQYVGKKDYTGKSAELEANAHQIEVLRLIGAPQSEIAYMLAQTGDHFDVNKDGIYDKKDYEQRDW
jgi:hypothetical protein